MSFSYKGTQITTDNYTREFQNLGRDTLDEIRSGVLDDTPLGLYIDVCGDDYEKLGEYRRALRDRTPLKLLPVYFSARTIREIRQRYKETTLEYKELQKQIENRVPEDLVKYLIILEEAQVKEIGMIDYTKVSEEQMKSLVGGMLLGYPMWMCLEIRPTISGELLKLCVRGMQLGYDIHLLLDKEWSESQLSWLLSREKQEMLDLISVLDPKMSEEHMKRVEELYRLELSYEYLCVRNKARELIISEQKSKVLRDGIIRARLSDEEKRLLISPKVTDEDCNMLLTRGLVSLERILVLRGLK